MKRLDEPVAYAVWVEVNDNHNDEDIAKLNDGLMMWEASGAVKSAIITNIAHRAESFAQIKTGLRLIPMLRTWRAFGFDAGKGHPDGHDGWAKIGQYVEQELDSPIVGLDVETLFRAYVKGEMQVDLSAFVRGFRCLPSDRRYLWYPAVESHHNIRQARQIAMCACVAAVHDVDWFNRSFDRRSKACETSLEPTLRHIGTGTRWDVINLGDDADAARWPLDDVFIALHLTRPANRVINVGWNGWPHRDVLEALCE